MRRALLAVAVSIAALAWPAGAHAAPVYTDADYFGFADRVVAQLAPTWDAAVGYYTTTAPGLDSRYNAALLTVFATAAAAGHTRPAPHDPRAPRPARAPPPSP